MSQLCKLFYCYKITNVLNGKAYIGFATDPQMRWREHKRTALSGKGYALHKAIRKHGWTNFQLEVIVCGRCKRDMLAGIEPLLIKQHETLITQHGYNISRGGEKMHFVQSDPKTRGAKISSAKKGKPNGLLGKKFSKEHRSRMSNARNGMKFSEEHRQRLSESHRGKPTAWAGRHHTPEAKRKVSESLRGVPRAAKNWLVTYPDGREEVVHNLKQFCRTHQLTPGNMTTVSKGRAKHHKGFQCSKVSDRDVHYQAVRPLSLTGLDTGTER